MYLERPGALLMDDSWGNSISMASIDRLRLELEGNHA